MQIVLLGGIGEAVWLANRLADRHALIYSLVGRAGTAPAVTCPVRVGGFSDVAELAALLRAERSDLLVDATHPYAARISHLAIAAARQAGVPLWAYRRPAWQPQPGDDWRTVADWAGIRVALVEFRRPFFTIGLAPLSHRAEIPVTQQWLVRCVAAAPASLPRLTVLQSRGPFMLEQELAVLRDWGVDVLVSKNSGGPAVAAKLAAARTLGLPVLLLARPVLPAAEVEFTSIAALADEIPSQAVGLG
jgi:precorrin-6A/cobalt-precorrin-6A reductase